MKNLLLTSLLLFTTTVIMAQKKVMDQGIYKIWKKIEKPILSNNGQWVAYLAVCNAECDPSLLLWNVVTETTTTFERGADAQFTFDNSFLIFKIKQPLDSLKAKRRKKVKDEDLPKDSLGIYNLSNGNLNKIAHLKSFLLPQKWAGFVAFQLEIEKPTDKTDPSVSKDSAATQKLKIKPKAESKDNGSKLILMNLGNNIKDTFSFITDYVFAKRGKRLLITDTGKDSVDLASVDIVNCENREKQLIFEKNKGKFKQLALDETGQQAAFIADLDTSKERIRPFSLHYWKNESSIKGRSEAKTVELQNLPTWAKGCFVSENAKPIFSEDGSKLYFGIAPKPILNDTTLLPEEIVNVEVWAYNDKKIHPQQRVQLESEKKRAYSALFMTQSGAVIPLAGPDMPDINFADHRNADVVVGYTAEPYQVAGTWEGFGKLDIFSIDLKNGNRILIAKGVKNEPQVSPSGKYIYWFNRIDSAWFAYSVATKTTTRLTDNAIIKFYDEENDIPDFPNSYNSVGWTKDDKYLLIYDRFDMWQVDPLSKEKPVCLTNGRASETVFRYIKLDDEERFIDLNKPLMLHSFDEKTKAEGYVMLNANTKTVSNLVQENAKFSAQPMKAQETNAYIFAKQNFQTTPDLLYTNDFKSIKKISDINPQQNEYAWGTIELVEWRSLNGELLRGMLVKPEGFDPKKKYPMIVNFYEKSTDELNNYRGPEPLRSQINYSFYANHGYIIFNPDIPYRTGYPGESCLSSVVSGVSHLIEQGFVDEKRIGVQGHSWGGYQAAYLITKTNIFRCVEAGAPVVNMISAYGGIRWETGVLRQFQYEHQQSRIGGSIWEYPLRYMENSPIFSADKINTPVLIMANDKDGAVPWYQGIEFYSAMRRLNKPAWLLNYNDEPHWPVKLQNRIDFQTRMQQFFDYYLKDTPMPIWMERGVPATR